MEGASGDLDADLDAKQIVRPLVQAIADEIERRIDKKDLQEESLASLINHLQKLLASVRTGGQVAINFNAGRTSGVPLWQSSAVTHKTPRERSLARAEARRQLEGGKTPCQADAPTRPSSSAASSESSTPTPS